MNDNALQCIDVCMLPPQIRFLVELIGLPDTVKLLKAKGGHRLLIPTGKQETNQLNNIISSEAVKILCNSQYAGHRLTLPKADKILDQIRNLHIRASAESTTKSELASQYNLTQRHIQRLRNEDQDNNPTLDMFDESVG